MLEAAYGALAAIEAARGRVDDLNVYPVPDGDTGTNLALTVRAVVDALEAEGPDDRAGLAHEVSRAALMGARTVSARLVPVSPSGTGYTLRSSMRWRDASIAACAPRASSRTRVLIPAPGAGKAVASTQF